MLWKTCVNRYISEVSEDLSPERLISLVTWPLMKSTHPVRLRSRDEILVLMEVFVLQNHACNLIGSLMQHIICFVFCLQGGLLSAATSHDGRTPIHVACLEGQLQVIRYLLEKGASPHVFDNHGQTPLHDAIRSNNEEAILLLREFGAHLGPTTVNTALEICSLAADDKVDRLRAWHLAGVDFNVGDYDRRTALHVVSLSNYFSHTEVK